jgi:hypothetical protein
MEQGYRVFQNVKSRFQSLAAIVVLLLIVSGVASTIDAKEITAKVSFIRGDVLVVHHDQTSGPAKKGMRLQPGDHIQTAEGARVNLKLSDGTELYLGEHTSVDVAMLIQEPKSGARLSTLKLLYGRLRTLLSRKHQKKGSAFTVVTPNAQVGVQFSHPDIEVIYDPTSATTMIGAYAVDTIVQNLTTQEEKTVPRGSQGIVRGTYIWSTPLEKIGNFSANEPEKTLCDAWTELRISDYLVSNNVWGEEGISDYTQCLVKPSPHLSFPIGWTWDWPRQPDRVKAYPEIIYGWKPWSKHSTTPNLPAQISQLESMLLHYDVDTTSTGSYNLMVDLWLCNSSTPSEDTITNEIAIWLQYQDWQMHLPPTDTVTIDGEEYVFYNGNVGHAAWPYLAFVKRSSGKQGTIDMRQFLDYLVQNQHISATDYLTSVEMGNEIRGGTGKTLVYEYSITFE